MQVYRICYRARINWLRLRLCLSDEIEHSLSRIRQINRRAGVTGALLMTDNYMIQLLEGDTGRVLETLYCVMGDPRLSDFEAIFHEPSRDRLFPDSLMFFRDLTERDGPKRHAQLRSLIDRPSPLSRQEGLDAFSTFADDVAQGRLTNGMMMI
ncbi:BLUF domain-containing protein [Roseibium sp. RKSG952]|uniref:BLUF domain-containing protein n=1 Tax=Roseibium sp. RKSG952 TaxID=2529384 RepID=UPI0012BBDC3E|nr:BLUF domain-containing protein [Roseibium sp. RKSG952]MTH97535.1 blue light sensor protein [Roseibium sp. RKSG952]